MKSALLLAALTASLLTGSASADSEATGPTPGSSEAAETAPTAAPPKHRIPASPLLDPLRGGHLSAGDERSAAVFPPQQIEITFDHGLHLSEAGLTCLDCHESVKTSRKARDHNIPARELCLDCHDSPEIPWRWSARPGRRESAIVMPPAHLHFDHARHLALPDVSCASCHADMEKVGLATREQLPSMETCLGCHDGVSAAADCRTCHLPGRGGTIRTEYPEGSLIPDDHGVHWLKQHEIDAERGLAYCASCHQQEDCLECHEGSIPPTFHDGNYLAQHPRDGIANNPTCASCHRVETFCRDCHFRAGVTQQVNPLPAGFHPPGWGEFTAPGELPGPKHHAHVARKSLNSCRGCHAEDDCLSCHLWFPGAPRTHGPGFKGSEQARRLRRENLELCLRCHSLANPDDPINAP